jgi:hypothetical protein
MSTFDIVVILGAICGLLMVIGGMVLLYKGAISLNQANREGALTIDYKKTLKITTHYPALGLFIIGLAFAISAIYFSHNEQKPIQIKGRVNVDDPYALNIVVSVPEIRVGSAYEGGKIIASIVPKTDILNIRFSYPGYRDLLLPIETQKYKSTASSLLCKFS